MHSSSLVHRVAHPDCNADQLRIALEQGFDPNYQWEKLDIEKSDFDLERRSHFSGENTWANVNTPLHRFSLANKLDAASLLLEHGAQMEGLNAEGKTALHEAVVRNLSEVVKFLIENGANVNARSEARSFRVGDSERWGRAGRVPLHEAIYNSSLGMVGMLLGAGANYNHVSPGGWTILDLAFLHRNRSIVSVLLQYEAQTSRKDTFDESELTTLRESARLLVANRALLPSDECRIAYLHVVCQSEFTIACKELSAIRHPLDVFLDLLARTAGLPNPENVPGAPRCISCAKYLEQLSLDNKNPFDLYPNRCSLTRSAKDGCCLCAVVDDALKEEANGSASIPADDDGGDMKPTPVLLAFNHRWSQQVIVSCGETKRSLELYPMSGKIELTTASFLECFLVDHRRFPDDPKSGTASPRAFEMGRAWFRNCQLNHPCCKDGTNEDPALPTRIINVGDSSKPPFLHQSSGEHAPYLALSYCWGRRGNFRTTRDSLLDHTRGMPLDVFPATLRDAIIATRELGFRYLWIDSICIVQDDMEDWDREASKMQNIYMNAAITLSALASDESDGGLFRPREPRFTSPVQLSLHIPPRYRPSWGQSLPKLYWFLLPAQASEKIFKPGPVHSRAWTLQEQHLSRRIIHYGSGMMCWECLSAHGSELDPEGQSHAYRRTGNPFQDVRKQKRFVQGCPNARDLETYSLAEDNEEIRTATRDRLPRLLCQQWQDLVSEYSSRELSKPRDKVFAFMGLSKTMEGRLQDEFIAGIWKNDHFLPSLLWNTIKPGATSRTPQFPSWTWASLMSKVQYQRRSFARVSWEPSSATLNINLSHNHLTGSITLRSTVRKFPPCFEFGLYNDRTGHGTMWRRLHKADYDVKERMEQNPQSLSDIDSQEQEKDRELVVSGFRDIKHSGQDLQDSADNLERTGDDIYCVVIVRIPQGPPAPTGRHARGFPMFPQGRPKSLVCLCLTRVDGGEVGNELQTKVYRRTGLCEFWDRERFWKGAVEDEWVTII